MSPMPGWPPDPRRDEDDLPEYEIVGNDEPSLEDYPSMERAADESALIESEAEWASEAEAEAERVRRWGAPCR